MTIVFDFDKTLSYGDSMTDLFIAESGPFSRIYYFFLKALSKSGVISVTTEKTLMIRKLFGGKSDSFESACRKQAGRIKLTPIYGILKECIKKGDRVIILSATSRYLLEEIFKDLPDIEILGSEFLVENGIINGFSQHPFGNEKVAVLSRYGIARIDDAYFDSKNDECLKCISTNWHKVKNGIVIEQNI